MRTRRKPFPDRSQRLRAIIVAGCALAGLGLMSPAFSQQAPAPTTHLGTLVVTPADANAPVLAPAHTTVRPGAPAQAQPTTALATGNRPGSGGPGTPNTRPRLKIHTSPQALRIVAPKYPPAALAQSLRGSVKVAFTIEPDGHTGDIHIVSSQPAKIFDQATLQAVRQWRFEPATVNGQPVPMTVTQSIVFNPPLQQEQAPAPPPPPAPAQVSAQAPPPKPAPSRVQVHAVHIVAPEYPPRAYRKGIGGSVTVRFIVGTDGQTHDIQILKATPRNIFNRATKQAVRKWRFKPVANPTPITQTIRFTPPRG